MRGYLGLPGMGSRRRSEGCLAEAFQSDRLINDKCENGVCDSSYHLHQPGGAEQARRNASRLNIANGVESNLLEVLRKNYDIVSALADIENCESVAAQSNGFQQMRGGPATKTFSSSPKPLVLQQNEKCTKCSFNPENTSISSSDTSDAEASEPLWNRLSEELKWFFYDIAEAFNAPISEETNLQPKVEQQKLSAVTLRRDLKRCYSFLHPLVEVGAAIYDMLLWKNPMYTLLLTLAEGSTSVTTTILTMGCCVLINIDCILVALYFLSEELQVYTYSIIRGWTASLALLLLWTQLSLNYFKTTKNVDIGLYFLPRKEVIMPKFDITGAQLILDVAKIAQNFLNFAANFLEKLHSLLTWKDRRVTFVFYCLVIYWLTLSMVFNTGTCLGMCGLTIGVRIFITTYLFQRFPRLRKRLDTYGWFYRNLPVKASRENFPQLMLNAEPLPSLTSKTASPLTRRSQNINGLFNSRLGSNFNLNTADSQLSLNSQRHNSFGSAQNFPLKGSIQNLHKSSFDGSSEKVQCTNPHLLLAEATTLSAPHHRSVHLAVSPLIAPASRRSPTPPLDPPPCDVTTISVDDDENDDDVNKSTTLSIYSTNELDSMHDDPMIDNVLAYRSCVMKDKDKTFPKGISSGILYLTDNALIYQSKSTVDEKAPTIMLFTDVAAIRKTQSFRTMGLLTGTRKSLEVSIEGKRKPLQFIGLAQRDDFYSRIQLLCEHDTHIQFL